MTGDKVILAKDIAYLKEQLGAPGDFGDAEPEETQEDTAGPKRLFRDTEHGMIAGVCAGVARYLGTDPVWVRLAFVALVLLGASGILLYIVMWLIIPEAKTKSDRLQMQGKPVTVDALKDVVRRADVEGAARRTTRVIDKTVRYTAKAVLGIVGFALAVFGAVLLAGIMTAGTYLLLSGSQVNNQVVFPVGVQELVGLVCGLVAALILASVFLVCGMHLTRSRRALPGWLTGSLLALFLVLTSVCTAIALDSRPKVSERVDQAQQYLVGEECEENIFSYCTIWHADQQQDTEINN